MTNYESLQQLARMMGQDKIAEALGLSVGNFPETITQDQTQSLHRLIEHSVDELSRALLDEAILCDDVIDSDTAVQYVEDRMNFLSDVISDDQNKIIAKKFKELISGWP